HGSTRLVLDLRKSFRHFRQRNSVTAVWFASMRDWAHRVRDAMKKAPFLVTKAEAAGQLSVSIRFIEHLIRAQHLPVVRLGWPVRIPTRALAALAARGISRRRPDGRDLVLRGTAAAHDAVRETEDKT